MDLERVGELGAKARGGEARLMEARREMELPGAALEGEGGDEDESDERLCERLDDDLGVEGENPPIPDPCTDLVVSSASPPKVASPVLERRRGLGNSSVDARPDGPAKLPGLPPMERILVVLAVLLASTSGLLSRALGVRRCELRA